MVHEMKPMVSSTQGYHEHTNELSDLPQHVTHPQPINKPFSILFDCSLSFHLSSSFVK